jgi:wobble nucleotide-excising tRNase
MIKQIKLNNVATFTDVTKATMNPRKINFCYGSNGSGKTTISNVIAEYQQNNAMISWDSTPIQTLVYNREFIAGNFGETSKIGGIFTLGKDSKEAQEFIIEQRSKTDECGRQIEGFNKSKEKLDGEQQTRETKLDNDCWKIKETYDSVFSEAFSGLNNSKRRFRDKCTDAAKMVNQVQPNIDELKRLYAIAFGEARPIYPPYPLFEITQIASQEKCDILIQKITGSSDTPIGKFIEYLGNSDWVKAGISFADKVEGKCPFCQQELPPTIYDDIKAFFDDSYDKDFAQLKAFHSSYSQFTNDLLLQLRGYEKNPLPILDYTLFKSEIDSLALLMDKNVKAIESKINSPSTEVGIDSLSFSLKRINEIITDFNKLIEESTDFAKHQKDKQQECIKDVWQFIAYTLKNVIDIYNRETKGNQDGIKHLDEMIKTQSDQQKEYHRLISEKEAAITSVKPTADAITSILTRFGFEGFSIIENPSEVGTYKIIRSDGKCVEKTLSEGEYNFISFFYFYHLVYGSKDKTGIAQSKVVVIDDPISSLDSNVLFIVSTLTKQILDECKNGREGIKQVFVLTHNVYFHKEITFLGSRNTWKKDEAAFWVIKKNKNVSHIVDCKNRNPIQTSYELLWSELKDTESVQRITIFNTLRRILEYYFNVIGGLDYEECINKFDGEDKLICKALISCINEGSHFITDDFVMQYESAAMDSYIRVFKLIFEKMGHESHYKMMMHETIEQEENSDITQPKIEIAKTEAIS